MAYGGDWSEISEKECLPSFHPENEYFACLPKHNENGQCLHWLNEGEIQVMDDNSWDDCGPHQGRDQSWSVDGFLMIDHLKYRIKPRKEKRWVAIDERGMAVPTLIEDEDLLENAKKSLMHNYSFHQIEIEV